MEVSCQWPKLSSQLLRLSHPHPMQTIFGTTFQRQKCSRNAGIWSSLSSWQRSTETACKNQFRLQHRSYSQQRTARIPQSAPTQSTSKPTRTSQLKNSNRNSSAALASHSNASSTSGGRGAITPASAATASQVYASKRMQDVMTEDGMQVAAARAKAMGVELWGTKFPLLGGCCFAPVSTVR